MKNCQVTADVTRTIKQKNVFASTTVPIRRSDKKMETH
jgi:hypothetical protein